MTPEEAQGLAKATNLLQSRQSEAAAALLSELARRYPQQAEIPHLQAVIAFQSGDRAGASALFAQALELSPQAAHIHNNYANFLQASQLPEQAIGHYQQALALVPDHLEAHVNLGGLLLDTDPARARGHLETALKLQPRHPQAAYLLGLLAHRAQDQVTAIQCLTRAFQLGFEPAHCAHMLAEIAVAEQAYPQALSLIQQAMQQPDPPLGVLDLHGLILYRLGQLEAADSLWLRAQAKAPAETGLFFKRSAVAFARQHFAEAESLLLQALQGTQDAASRADIYENLANTRRSMSDMPKAVEYLDRALELRPRTGLIYRRGLMLPGVYASEADIAHWRGRLQTYLDAWSQDPPALEDPDAEVGESLFLLAHQGLDDRPMMQQLGQIYLKACPDLSWTAPHCRVPVARPAASTAKLRIGFISRFFRRHTVAKLMRGLIAHWPRDNFEVVLCSFAPPVDEIARWMAEHADAFVLLPPGLSAARQALAEQALDVLLYSDTGMESLTYFLSFARLAPLQCTTWGHGITSGVPNVDLFLSSTDLEGDDPQQHYSETLRLSEHLFPYYYKPQRQSEAAADLHLPSGNLYGCLQTLIKLHPNMDAIIRQILERDPQGRIVLIGETGTPAVEQLQERFAASLGEHAGRIYFHPPVSEAAFLELLAACAVHLDPLVFCGGNSSYEALAVGAPVVTLPTQQLKGRITYALYAAMQWTELVAQSHDDYLAKALRLGTDPAWRAEIGRQIESRNAVLFENRAGVDEMAALVLAEFSQNARQAVADN